MKMKFIPASLFRTAGLLSLVVLVAQPTARSAENAKTIQIVANDTLKFDVTRIEASPGETLHVQLRNEGTLPKDGMGHNWILLDSDAEATSYAMAAISARDVAYQPKALASHVLAVIPLLGPHEIGEVTFNAPVKPGKYPFICSCFGHSIAGMRGELIVK